MFNAVINCAVLVIVNAVARRVSEISFGKGGEAEGVMVGSIEVWSKYGKPENTLLSLFFSEGDSSEYTNLNTQITDYVKEQFYLVYLRRKGLGNRLGRLCEGIRLLKAGTVFGIGADGIRQTI